MHPDITTEPCYRLHDPAHPALGTFTLTLDAARLYLEQTSLEYLWHGNSVTWLVPQERFVAMDGDVWIAEVSISEVSLSERGME